MRIVIVVDALNEDDREEDVSIIIHLLSQVKHCIQIPLSMSICTEIYSFQSPVTWSTSIPEYHNAQALCLSATTSPLQPIMVLLTMMF